MKNGICHAIDKIACPKFRELPELLHVGTMSSQMKALGKNLSGNKPICWLLVLVLCLASVFPVHFHMHHDENAAPSAQADHVIDLHIMSDPAGQSHHGEESHSFASSADGIIKKVGFSPYVLAFLAVLLVLLPLPAQILRTRSRDDVLQLIDRYRHFSPPLRAPPLH